MKITHDGNMASARVGKLWIAAAGSRPIADEAWREYLEAAASSVKKDGPYHGVLFWAPKYGPSGPQRKLLTDDYTEAIGLDLQRRVALISESAMVRGAITAIKWFTRSNVTAFAPKDAERAIEWLAGDIDFDRGQAKRALDDLIGAVKPRPTESASSSSRLAP